MELEVWASRLLRHCTEFGHRPNCIPKEAIVSPVSREEAIVPPVSPDKEAAPTPISLEAELVSAPAARHAASPNSLDILAEPHQAASAPKLDYLNNIRGICEHSYSKYHNNFYHSIFIRLHGNRPFR